MANNRLLIRCTICGKDVPIARQGAGSVEWEPARAEAIPAWEAFLLEHGEHDGTLHLTLTSENDWLIDLR